MGLIGSEFKELMFVVLCTATMQVPRFCLLLLCTLVIVSYSNAFQHGGVIAAPTTQQIQTFSTSKLMVASELFPTDEDECSIESTTGPASVFGRPINQDTKEFNRDLIKTCKTALFDKLFQGSEISRCYARFYALENIARMPWVTFCSLIDLCSSFVESKLSAHPSFPSLQVFLLSQRSPPLRVSGTVAKSRIS